MQFHARLDMQVSGSSCLHDYGTVFIVDRSTLERGTTKMVDFVDDDADAVAVNAVVRFLRKRCSVFHHQYRCSFCMLKQANSVEVFCSN